MKQDFKQNKYDELKKQDTMVEQEQDTMVEQEQENVELVFKKAAVKNDCELLNVREEPRKDAKIVTVIRKGTEVDLILEESTENWFKVSVNGFYGFCMKEYLEFM